MRKLIVVTGGSQGIGRAIVSRFAAEGFDIATCARHAGDLEGLKIHIEKLYPNIGIYTQQADPEFCGLYIVAQWIHRCTRE
jgi:NAD(P)-dependent dehydrogenase (short-subunit alcohol dehydrogenase family)